MTTVAGRAASVSLCVMTRGPADRVAALLGLWRPVVAEIVLAVDAGGDLGTVEACAALADKRFVFEREPDWTPERLLPWLYAQCAGEWALRMDDDEIPSASLLRSLPGLVTDTAARTIHLPRRWLFPTAGEYIVAKLWSPDWQVRLTRRASSAATGALHTSLETMGPRVWAESAPIYHADALELPLERRREKAARYEALRPGHATPDGSVNAMYLPEDAIELRTAAVPAEDLELIKMVLERGAPAGGRPRMTAAVERVSADRMLSHLPTGGSLALFRARRAVLAAGRRMAGRG